MKPLHKCKIHCHSMDPATLEAMGLEEDQGKWLAFCLRMDTVIACKMATDEDDTPYFGCTSVFVENGDTFIIDTPYDEFEDLFMRHYNMPSSNDSSSLSEKDINL